jgi:hypothetical protein
MLAVQNTIGIKLGNVLHGSAEGPLGIGALLGDSGSACVYLLSAKMISPALGSE